MTPTTATAATIDDRAWFSMWAEALDADEAWLRDHPGEPFPPLEDETAAP